MVQTAVDNYGRLDFACNNAGISGDAAFVADMPEEQFDRAIAVMLRGVFLCMKKQHLSDKLMTLTLKKYIVTSYNIRLADQTCSNYIYQRGIDRYPKIVLDCNYPENN